MKKNLTRQVCLAAVMTALQIVLSRYLSVQAVGMKFSFSFIPIVIAGMILGPLWAGGIGAVSDILGALIFSSGTYHPGFTAVAFAVGAVFGLLLRDYPVKSIKFWAFTVLAVIINNLGFELLLNSLWISQLYGKTYLGWIAARLVQYAVMVPLQIVLMPFIKTLSDRLKVIRI